MLILSLLNVHLMSVLPIDDFIFQHSEKTFTLSEGFFVNLMLTYPINVFRR